MSRPNWYKKTPRAPARSAGSSRRAKWRTLGGGRHHGGPDDLRAVLHGGLSNVADTMMPLTAW